MLSHGARVGAVALIAGIVTALLAAPARGDDGSGGVNCAATPNVPVCKVHVGTKGKPPRKNDGGSGGSDSPAADSPCRWERVESTGPPPAGKNPNGSWFVRICQLPNGASAGLATWMDTPPGLDVAALSRQAVARLELALPAIRTSPTADGPALVQVPVWLWLDRSSWADRTATASVPGFAITATATAKRVRWEMGDGKALTCDGPGTAWSVATDPRASSPTCGHTYTRSGDFAMRATVTWSVTWAGGGISGAVPDLTTSATAPIRVVQSQAINGGVA